MGTFNASSERIEGTARSAATRSVLHGRDSSGLTVLTTTGTAQIVQKDGTDWVAGASDEFVRMQCDVSVWVSIAAAPVAAVSTAFRVNANDLEVRSVEPGDKISVINA